MVIVETLDDIDVEGDTASLGKGLHDVGDHLTGQGSDHLALQAQVDICEGPS